MTNAITCLPAGCDVSVAGKAPAASVTRGSIPARAGRVDPGDVAVPPSAIRSALLGRITNPSLIRPNDLERHFGVVT